MIDEKTVDTEKIIDEIQEEFEKVNIPIMDKLTLFAKVQNAIYRCSEIEREPCEDCISRKDAMACCRNEWEEEVADRIEALPSVQPKLSFINKPCISEGVCHDIAVQKMIKCEDAVSREAVFDVLNCGEDLPDRLFDMVEELPKVYLEPNSGHWIPDDTICEDTLYRCSNCDNVYYSNYGDIKDMGYNYCPNCGCQMLEG